MVNSALCKRLSDFLIFIEIPILNFVLICRLSEWIIAKLVRILTKCLQNVNYSLYNLQGCSFDNLSNQLVCWKNIIKIIIFSL